MTPRDRRLCNMAIVAVCCMAWGILIVLGVGLYDAAYTYFGGTR